MSKHTPTHKYFIEKADDDSGNWWLCKIAADGVTDIFDEYDTKAEASAGLREANTPEPTEYALQYAHRCGYYS